MLVRATRQEICHRYKLHCVPLGKKEGNKLQGSLLLRKSRAGCSVSSENVLHYVLSKKPKITCNVYVVANKQAKIPVNKLYIVRLGDQGGDKLQNADDLQCVPSTRSPGFSTYLHALCSQGCDAMCHSMFC